MIIYILYESLFAHIGHPAENPVNNTLSSIVVVLTRIYNYNRPAGTMQLSTHAVFNILIDYAEDAMQVGYSRQAPSLPDNIQRVFDAVVRWLTTSTGDFAVAWLGIASRLS